MMNQSILIGRVNTLPYEIKTEDKGTLTAMTVLVPRSFKEDGEYITDCLKIVFESNTLSNNAKEYLRQGDLVGVKGRLTDIDGQMYLVVEKITYLSSARKEGKDNE